MVRDLPAELGNFLNAVVARRKRLRVYILNWDFALLYALERVAFVGGFDLARNRWDTPEHAPDDERRSDHGSPYPPFHDVQMLVEGEAAALGELARECSGWLEESTVGVLRARLLRRLGEADRFHRLRLFYPERSDLGGRSIQVHSKVMVADDLFVRVGSANLNNRSMGLDSECDLAIEAGTRVDVREAIRVFRNRLLGEHLGVSPQRLEAALAAEGSIIRAIEALQHPPRFLAPLNVQVEPWVDTLVPEATLIDPESPAQFEDLTDALVPPEKESRRGARPRGVGILLLLSVVLVRAAAWRWTHLSEWLDLQTLKEWGATFRGNHYALLRS